jgi:hypothetical protein
VLLVPQAQEQVLQVLLELVQVLQVPQAQEQEQLVLLEQAQGLQELEQVQLVLE